MRTRTVLILPALALLGLAYHLRAGAVATGRTCTACQISSCQLLPGEWTVRHGGGWDFTCIDFDGTWPGHCCITERQDYFIYRRDPIYPTTVMLAGFCWRHYCQGAQPTTQPCYRPWTFPSGAIGGPPQDDAGCPAGGK